ncbi:sulfotransferase [Rhodobacteraceae bacterium NNCM2]|nr:sulfotransferase [Coraliihabitans acroporae]
MAHPLCGADIRTLTSVFRAGGMPDHWLTAAGIWGAALGRAPLSGLEHLLLTPGTPRREEMPPPIFILGHWRSGTTHLYNIMSLGNFGYVPPVAVGMPWDMLGLARVIRPMLERQLPETRFIDNIPVTPTSPQEDEIGLANMSPLSFYHGIYFPRQFDRLIDRGLFFDGCSEAEIEAWQQRFILFMRRLAKHQGKQLLIKNPTYTARPAMLKQLFPGAKFIHIHRNPFDVFLSMRNFYNKLLAELALQDVPKGLDIDATICRVYARMMEAFEAETKGWESPEFVELPYALLDREPMAALERIYTELELPGFDAAAPAFRSYLDGVRTFQKNRFKGDQAAIDKVVANWTPWLEKWGYEAPIPA